MNTFSPDQIFTNLGNFYRKKKKSTYVRTVMNCADTVHCCSLRLWNKTQKKGATIFNEIISVLLSICV